MMKPKALTSEAIGRAKLHQVHFYWKTARDTLHFDGIASGFAMFLNWMPDQVGHDVIAGMPGNLTGYNSRRYTDDYQLLK